ncbi:MAG TPA: DUF2726 domain-containing protein [Burkholderiales bacterium]|nr:DUF2726 domain-containing protein [Burkholderiales bacterium]
MDASALTLIAVLLAGLLIWRYFPDLDDPAPPETMPAAHADFYARLVRSLPKHLVLSRVPLTDLIEAERRYGVFAQDDVQQLKVDFAVYGMDAKVVAAIDVHGGAFHSTSEDERKGRMLRAAGIALLRYSLQSPPSAEELQTALGYQRDRPVSLAIVASAIAAGAIVEL